MKAEQNPELNPVPRPQAEMALNPASIAAYTSQEAYHELDEVPVRKIDPLEQLERNLEALHSTQARLQFVMREVRYLMKV
jgi:hypothetical protein